MTPEELEELKSVGEAVAVGERSPNEFYELLAIHAGELIEAVEECQIDRDYMAECRSLEEENDNLKRLLKESSHFVQAMHNKTLFSKIEEALK